MILGLASETDSETSHAAIMARSMGIPAVFQLGKGVAAAAAGCRAVVDAEHAQLIIDPTAAQLRQVKARRAGAAKQQRPADPLAAAPCRTRDGHARLFCWPAQPAPHRRPSRKPFRRGLPALDCCARNPL